MTRLGFNHPTQSRPNKLGNGDPLSVTYFSLISWVMGGVPQAPPPLGCDLDRATGQGSVFFLGLVVLYLEQQEELCFPKNVPQAAGEAGRKLFSSGSLGLVFKENVYSRWAFLKTSFLKMAKMLPWDWHTRWYEKFLDAYWEHVLMLLTNHRSQCVFRGKQLCKWLLARSFQKKHTANCEPVTGNL